MAQPDAIEQTQEQAELPEATTPGVEVSEVEPQRLAQLKQQAPHDLRIQKQLAVIAIVFIAAFLLLVYLPSVRTVSRLHERVMAGTQMLESNLERGRALPELRAAADRLDQELVPFKPLPSERSVGEVINETSLIGRQLSLRSLSREQQQLVVENGLGIAPVRLSFEGNFENVYGFLRRCEELPHPVRISELKIQQKPGSASTPLQPGEVSVTMILDVFFKPETPTGA